LWPLRLSGRQLVSQARARIVFCTDPAYPPEESLQGSKPVGSDIDIGSGLARLCQGRVEKRGFDGIIAALLGATRSWPA
jgi:hypothetical protein